MKILNAAAGKIGQYILGPKHYLNEDIRFGEAAICIGRDEATPQRPCVWLVGGIELIIDYLSLARTEGTIDDDTSNNLLKQMDEAKRSKPSSAIDRLASVVGVDNEELYQLLKLAQVSVTAPISGIQDFSNQKPIWLAKTNKQNDCASIH